MKFARVQQLGVLFCAAAAVFGVAEERIARVGEVGAYLVAAPGDELDPQQAESPAGSDRVDYSLDVAPVGAFERQDLSPVALLVLDQFVLKMQVFAQLAAGYAVIELADEPVLAEHLRKGAQGLGVLAENDYARGVAVEPVDGAGREALLRSGLVCPGLDQVVRDLVGQGVLLFAAVAVHEEPEGLVDRDEVVVLVGDGELALGVELFLFAGVKIELAVSDVERDNVALAEHGAFGDFFAVQLDVLAERFVNVRQRSVAQILLEEAVQALSAVVGCNKNFPHIVYILTQNHNIYVIIVLHIDKRGIIYEQDQRHHI